MNDGNFFNYENLNNYIFKSSNRQKNSWKRNEKVDNLVETVTVGDENKNYGNFTKEFYKERYNIPSKIPTPSNFNYNDHECRGEYAISLIKKKIEKKEIMSKISNLNFFSWIRAYNKLTDGVKIDINLLIDNKDFNVSDTVSKFFSDFTFKDSQICICEVTEIKFLDCIQIIECKDYELKCFEITFDEVNISDTHFQKGDIILMKKTLLRPYMLMYRMSVNKIKIL